MHMYVYTLCISLQYIISLFSIVQYISLLMNLSQMQRRNSAVH